MNLPPGLHRLTAIQSVGGQTSVPSATLEANVVDPGAPPPPQVSQPRRGVVSSDGRVAVAGKAAPGATVTVTATPAGAGGRPAASRSPPMPPETGAAC